MPDTAAISETTARLERYAEETNLVSELSEQDLATLGQRVIEEYEIDETSRKDWLADYDDYMQIVSMVSHGTVGKADTKYPLIVTAAIQFAARAMAAIIQGENVVKGKVIGSDPNGEKAACAERIGQHMSYQVLEDMSEWVEDTDRLMTTIAITGCEFKKTWHDPITGKPVSIHVSAKNLCVNNNAKSLERASRVTHIIDLYPIEIEERIRAGIFKKFEYEGQQGKDTNDPDSPHVFLEQHRRWDVDGDGYPEPVIVTLHKDSNTTVRITARFDASGIHVDEKNRVVMIEPVQYFTKFPFLNTFDGTFYTIGFGKLLFQNNDVINTVINQLLDAASDQITGGGFVSGSFNIKGGKQGGDVTFRKNEYKIVSTSGDDIRKQIYERPTAQPSPVSFTLLELLITASEKLASVSDALTGNAPPANTPATTTLSMVEQGLKVFGSIYARLHRAFKSEFKKIFRLNSLYLSEEAYYRVLDTDKAISRNDYNLQSCDVVSASDPNNTTDMQKLLKAEALMKLKGTGLNDSEIDRRYLEALSIGDIENILPDKNAESQPPPEVQMEMEKLAIEKEKLAIDRERLNIEKALADSDILYKRAGTMKLLADAEAAELGSQLDTYRAQVEGMEAELRMARGQDESGKPIETGTEEAKPEPAEGEGNASIPNGVGGMVGAPGNGGVPSQPYGAIGGGNGALGIGANSEQ